MSHHVFRYGGDFADLLIHRAEGASMYGPDGREVLDFTSGQMSGILGHSHPEIVATVRDAIGELDHVHSSLLSEPVLQLTEALADILPESLSKVLPLSTGGESNEAALRMAKMTTGGFEVVAFDRSWHGVTGGAGSSTFNGARQGYGPTLPGVFALPTPARLRISDAGPTIGGALRSGHGRTDPELGRHHRAAARLPQGAED
jgi:2,2-dialkylglycine decarboxylase (pyruvate)